MSSDEDASPAMQFTRSVRRTGSKALASPSDSENTPGSVGAPVYPGRQQQPSAASGYVRQQVLFGSSPGSPSLAKGALSISFVCAAAYAEGMAGV
jgi:hypothetical protein